MIKTFRGLLADGGQDRIRLSTIKGKVGYRVTKYELLPSAPGQSNYQATVQIWKEEQSSVSTSGATVNFTDSALLAAAIYMASSDVGTPAMQVTIFDNEIFNQDIYITHTGETGSSPMNYYIELEVIPLNEKGAEYMTIKDLRTRGF